MKASQTRGADPDSCTLGLDFGTGGARLAAIDPAGAILFETRSAFTHQDAPAWREALFELVAAVPAALRRRTHDIAICATSATALLCGQDGTPLLPAVLYHETRSADLLQFVPPTHLAASPSSSLAKLLWFAEQPPIGRARHFLHQADWLAFQLHGEPGLSDYHNALKLGYDVEALRYPDWLLALPVAPLLPRVLVPGAVAGQVRKEAAARLGLPCGCRVHAGTTDSIAAFFASGARQPGQAVTSLGSTLVLKLLSPARVDSAVHGIYSHRCGDLWLAGGASNCGGAVLERLFGRENLARLSMEIDPEVASPLEYYPLPARGERFPIADPDLEPRLEPRPDSDAEYLHGLLESLAQVERQGYQLLETLGAAPVREVFSTGGGAGNPAWRRIRERVLGLPVHEAQYPEAAYGAALLAAHGEALLYSTTAPTDAKNSDA